MSVTKRLVVLTVLILAPALAAALWGVLQVYRAEEESAEQTLRQLARALAAVVEQELAQRAAVLDTLARSPAMQRGDLRSFYDFARAMAPDFERTIVLADADGRQLVNTRLPFDAKLPVASTLPELRRRLGLADNAVLVSDVYFAPVGKRYSFAVQVPVMRDGRAAYFLSMGTFTDTLQKLLEDQRLGPGWNASIIDRKGVVIARRIDPERFVGRPGTPDLLERVSRSPEGLFDTVRLDGVPVLTAYTPVGATGWSFVVSMPRAVLQASLQRTLAATGLVMLLLFALAVVLALYASRSITKPLRALVESAAALGRNEPMPPARHRLREAQLIAAELERAGERLRGVNRELAARVDAAVTQAKLAQEALLQNQKLEALGRLTGGIAHDFNNLLQTISVGIEVTLRAAHDPNVTAAAEAAQRAVQNAVKLTRQLTTFGRGQGSAREAVDLRDYALKMQDLVARALRSDIELAFDFAGDLAAVEIDPLQLELALLNAALNARDAMPRGGRIVIGARNARLRPGEDPRVPAGDYVVLTITDNGEGIAKDVLPRVFEPFFTTKEVGKGSGLGLAQIYGFAVQSGGTATIESVPGRGTTVSVWLPPARRAPTQADPEPVPRTEARSPRTVLFVEDDALVQKAVGSALEAAGFKVLRAADVETAVKLVERNPGIDVVFSDIVMPGGRSGIDLAEDLRRRRPGLPVLLATGYASAPVPRPGVRILAKPYRIEELKSALAEAL